MRARSAAPGFTLIELIVVMAIVALLVTVATPRYFAYLDRSKEAVLRADLAVLRDALDKYHGDHGRYPPTLEELAKRRYLRAIPVDPLTEMGRRPKRQDGLPSFRHAHIPLCPRMGISNRSGLAGPRKSTAIPFPYAGSGPTA